MIVLHDDTDPVIITTGEVLDTEHGGTGSDLSETGPGVVIQGSEGSDLTVLELAAGELIYGAIELQTDPPATNIVAGHLAANNTSTRKFLMERAVVTDLPTPSWVQLVASDISSGQVALARGGTGSDLSSLGSSGVVVQESGGANLTTTEHVTLKEFLTIGPATVDMDAAIEMRARGDFNAVIYLGNSTLANYWGISHAIGSGGEQGDLRIYGSGGGDAITISHTDSVVTLQGGLGASGGLSASPRCFHTGDAPARASTDGTDSTPVNTEIYFAEVFVPVTCTCTGVALFNGSVASGNLKVGVADSTGQSVLGSASTAMSGTDAYQRIPFTASGTLVGPATYYVMVFFDNGTARFNTHTVGNFATGKRTGAVYSTGFSLNAITPTSTFTTALGPIASLY